jgi:hypothetical protein
VDKYLTVGHEYWSVLAWLRDQGIGRNLPNLNKFGMRGVQDTEDIVLEL